MWLAWSALSRATPFQQSGNITCRRSIEPVGHVGTVLEGAIPASAPQFQKVILRSCGLVACAFPATTFSPCGNVWMRASEWRR
jgi:hypothetical protein